MICIVVEQAFHFKFFFIVLFLFGVEQLEHMDRAILSRFIINLWFPIQDVMHIVELHDRTSMNKNYNINLFLLGLEVLFYYFY